jgi:HEAT repeat protein
MALWRGNASEQTVLGGPSPALARALCSAELGEPVATAQLTIDGLRELFQSAALLRDSVPFATVQLLAQLANDGRVEVRSRVAEALGAYVDLYPDRIEPLLDQLGSDVSRKVRQAAASSLGMLRWQRPSGRPSGT